MSLLGAAVFYILVTYALSIGYGVNHAATWASDSAPLDTIVGRYTGSAWAQTIDAMVAVSAFSSGLGLITLSTRVLVDISRNKLAPRWLSRSHPRFGTPYLGVLLRGADRGGAGVRGRPGHEREHDDRLAAGANTSG